MKTSYGNIWQEGDDENGASIELVDDKVFPFILHITNGGSEAGEYPLSSAELEKLVNDVITHLRKY